MAKEFTELLNPRHVILFGLTGHWILLIVVIRFFQRDDLPSSSVENHICGLNQIICRQKIAGFHRENHSSFGPTMQAYTLIVAVFIILLIQNTITAVGKASIESLVWILYCRIAPKFGHSKLTVMSEKANELRKIVAERRAISAQDNYAKWTKLNRQHDKLVAEIDQLQKDVDLDKAKVNTFTGYLIAVVTSIPIWFFRVWYRKAVLYYFPPSVLPRALEWCLALPFTVTGGVSLTIWMMAAGTVASSLVFLVTFPFEKKVDKPTLPETSGKQKNN